MKMRHPGQEITLPPHQSKMGLYPPRGRGWDAENEREIVLLTNHLKFGANTISATNKDRWQIELFFRVLKQNLKIKTFVGTSENALFTQILPGETAA